MCGTLINPTTLVLSFIPILALFSNYLFGVIDDPTVRRSFSNDSISSVKVLMYFSEDYFSYIPPMVQTVFRACLYCAGETKRELLCTRLKGPSTTENPYNIGQIRTRNPDYLVVGLHEKEKPRVVRENTETPGFRTVMQYKTYLNMVHLSNMGSLLLFQCKRSCQVNFLVCYKRVSSHIE
jgi:hypothetical protein